MLFTAKSSIFREFCRKTNLCQGNSLALYWNEVEPDMGQMSPALIDEIEAICQQINDAATKKKKKERLYRRLEEIYEAYFILTKESKADNLGS